MSEGGLFREMLDLTVRTVLSAGSALLAATVILGEFVPIPECVKLPPFSNFTNYFICLGASAHFAWACLGRKFAGQSNAAGAFFALCRTISLALAFSACLDYLQKSKSTDQVLTLGIKIMAGLIFVSMVSSIRAIISQKVSRQGKGSLVLVVIKCGDPTSQTLILNGLIQFVIALALLTYPMSVSAIMESAYKMKTLDLLALRCFASLDLGLSMMSFGAVGLNDEDASTFLNVRKVQYIMILACFMVMQYLNYFSAIHSLIILGVIIQFVYILLPKVKEELKNE